MRDHKREVQQLVRLLAYLTKHYDSDKLELLFLGSDAHLESKSSTKLAQYVEGRPFVGRTDLSRLGEILQKCSGEFDPSRSPLRDMFHKKSPKKKSIYVLTDGKLETGDAEQDYEQIKMIVNKIHAAGLSSDQIGIQLISFGNDIDGLRRLQNLDRLADTTIPKLPL